MLTCVCQLNRSNTNNMFLYLTESSNFIEISLNIRLNQFYTQRTLFGQLTRLASSRIHCVGSRASKMVLLSDIPLVALVLDYSHEVCERELPGGKQPNVPVEKAGAGNTSRDTTTVADDKVHPTTEGSDPQIDQLEPPAAEVRNAADHAPGTPGVRSAKLTEALELIEVDTVLAEVVYMKEHVLFNPFAQDFMKRFDNRIPFTNGSARKQTSIHMLQTSVASKSSRHSVK